MFRNASRRQNPPARLAAAIYLSAAGLPPWPNCLAKAAEREGILKNNRIDYMMK
jgi:hypothetical protein